MENDVHLHTPPTPAKTQPAWATLVDLPNELLLIIFAHLSSDDLYSLAVLCRRLHLIALPIYLSAHGIEDPQDFVSPGKERATLLLNSVQLKALPGLRLAFISPRIKSIVCLFDSRRSQWQMRSSSGNLLV